VIDLTDPAVQPPRRKPEWLKVRLAHGENYERLRRDVSKLQLHTVCQEAMCPNIGECWGAGTATIMILGDTCTRACKFCNVKTGSARGEVDWLEPKRVAEAVRDLGWKYLVLTAVDRDDLPDGGAAIDVVLEGRPEVLAHNLETVPRLQATVRDKRANFEQSLEVLARAKRSGLVRYTKTSLMLGFGESEGEIAQTMDRAREVGVDIFTMGQYLQPTKRHLDVVEYVTPEKFERLRRVGEGKGFRQVVSSPLSRSSYHAEQAFT